MDNLNIERHNQIGDTILVPFPHILEQSAVSATVDMIADVRQNLESPEHMILSIDSISPSALREVTPNSSLDILKLHNPVQYALISEIPDLSEVVLIGSDPLSFMILADVNIDKELIFEHFARIAAGAMLGGLISFGIGYEKIVTRRTFLKAIGVSSTGFLFGGLLGRQTSPLLDTRNPIVEAQEIYKGNIKKGDYSKAEGLDERTLLDLFKQSKIRNYIKSISGESYSSISVWGNDHFLSDNYPNLDKLFQDKANIIRYIEKGKYYLSKVLPKAKEIAYRQGARDEQIETFIANAYFDLENITLVKISETPSNNVLSRNLVLNPVITNTSQTNVISLLE